MPFLILLPFLFPALILLVAGISIVRYRARQRKASEQLAGLARRFALEFRQETPKFGLAPPPTVAGRYRNRAVRFFNYTTGSGKSRTTWSAVPAVVGGAGDFTLELFPENFFTRIGATLGLQDIRVGDPAFDRAFTIKSNHPDRAAAALLPEIRARLLAERANGARGHLTIKAGEVRYAEVGEFDDDARAGRLAGMLEAACDLAEVAEVFPA